MGEEGILSQLGIKDFTYPYKPWYIYSRMGVENLEITGQSAVPFSLGVN